VQAMTRIRELENATRVYQDGLEVANARIRELERGVATAQGN